MVYEDSPDKFSVIENVPTQARARTMALDTKTHGLFGDGQLWRGSGSDSPAATTAPAHRGRQLYAFDHEPLNPL